MASARPHARRVLCTLGLLVAGCDWQHFALVNSLPVEGDPAANPVVHVYLAVDGLAYETVAAAQRAGLLAPERWQAAKLVAMFPASSDSSWSRILHAAPLPGYELHYFDPDHDVLRNEGYVGLACHGVPHLAGTALAGPDYYRGFDSYADGYLDPLWGYTAIEFSLSESLDGLFIALEGRAETQHAFLGYLLELDVLGHMRPRAEVDAALRRLLLRIEQFRSYHPERRFVFTLLSDHGIDFVPAEPEHFVDARALLRDADVRAVRSFAEGRRGRGPFAVPIVHTPVSYLALHTEAAQADEVARRVSEQPSVDLVLSPSSPADAASAAEGRRWFSVWQRGRRALHVAYDAARDSYALRRDADLAALGLDLSASGTSPASLAEHLELSDEQAFVAAREGRYPDLLYRLRSALTPVSNRYPAEVLVSFRRPYTSSGFRVPFSSVDEQARHGFHGSLDAGSSTGVLLSEERALPAAVRSDTVLELFPRLAEHLRARGLELQPGDPGASLAYGQIP